MTDDAETPLLSAIRTLAEWLARERPGTPLRDVLTVAPAVDPPPEIVEALQHAADREPSEPDHDHDLATLLGDLLGPLDERSAQIFRARVLTDPRPTLQTLGDEWGLTRERGQVQGNAIHNVKRALREEASLSIRTARWRAHDLGRALGPMAPRAAPSTSEALARATRGAAEEDRDAVTVLLLGLAGPYEDEHGWLVRSGSRLPRSEDLWDSFGEHGTMPRSELVDPAPRSVWRRATCSSSRPGSAT